MNVKFTEIVKPFQFSCRSNLVHGHWHGDLHACCALLSGNSLFIGMKDISRNICREHYDTSYILYVLLFSPSGFDINKQKVNERVELTAYLSSSFGPSLADCGVNF
jgi:hypothetical protein